ncbi:DUF421 domain-containing protein [Bacillus pumilus]|nr:DUF421 domain-containing protein [Bacillus pumilus]OLP63041.1 hypothetical protein BACPU_35580 [Bacillus pumilus]
MLDVVWKAIVMILVGNVLLRIAGPKSIGQLTVQQTVIMISIGSIIIQPFIEHSLLETICAASIFIVALVIMEKLSIQFDFFEKIFSGKSVVILQDGEILDHKLKKTRLTRDQFMMRLKQQGISDINSLEKATLETNGQIGYELKPEEKPVTIKQMTELFEQLKEELHMTKKDGS